MPQIHGCLPLALLLTEGTTSSLSIPALPCAAGTSICSALQQSEPGELIQAETNLTKMNYSTGAGMCSRSGGKGKTSSLGISISGAHPEPAANNGVRSCTWEWSCYCHGVSGHRHTGTSQQLACLLAAQPGKPRAQHMQHSLLDKVGKYASG